MRGDRDGSAGGSGSGVGDQRCGEGALGVTPGEGMLRVIRDSGREFRRSKGLGRADRRFGEGILGAQGVGEGVVRVVGESGGDLRRGSKIWGTVLGNQGFLERILRVVRIRGEGFGEQGFGKGGSDFGQALVLRWQESRGQWER